MALTLRQIDAFRAVMLTGTLTEAAVHLGISQPAISRLIADMEAEIGYNLFERTGRRVVPTAEAGILIEEVKRALVGLDQIREAALEIGRFRYARLRLLTIPIISSEVVTGMIKSFAGQYPETFVSLEMRSPDAAVESVMSQQCDLGIVSGIPQNSAYASQTVVSASAQCIMPAGHHLAAKSVLVPEDLQGESFVSFRADTAFRAEVDSVFDRRGAQRLLRYEGRTHECVCGMVERGMGVSVVGPLDLDAGRLRAGLVARPLQHAPHFDISLIWSRHRPLAAMAEGFMAILTERVAARETTTA